MTPICRIMPSTSGTALLSATFPSDILKMEVPVIYIRLPVEATPINSPRLVGTAGGHALCDLVSFSDHLLYGGVEIREAATEHASVRL
jgi:hypothetical protein